MTDTAIIGGTGFRQLPGFKIERHETIDTPYGSPSTALVFGRLSASPPANSLVFLSRHGSDHTIPPHRINYRANIHALKEIGVQRIIALAAVGGILPGLKPGAIVLPHQIIDYTWGRAHTFFEDGSEGIKHIEFSKPYSEAVRQKILAAAEKIGVPVVDGAVHAVTQGPRLETAAEIDRLERDGADVVGMTAMPEAALARELDIEYATIALVVNPAAGRGEVTSMEMIAKHLQVSGREVLKIIGCL